MKKISVLIAFTFPVMLFAQSVAINTDASTPHSSAILDIKSDSKGLLIPRLTTIQRTSIVGPALGLTVFDTDTYNYWIFRGDVNGGWVELMNSLDKHWSRSGTNAFNLNPGNIGIGTNNPTEKLTINATDPAINFLNAGSAKGYLQASGNNMKLGTYFNNTTGNLVFNTRATDRMWIDETGKVGIGTATPSGLLTVNGANPYIEMQNNGVDKGFLLVNGDNLKIGTNSTNTTGNLVLQTKLVDRMTIDENGLVGIGTSSPSSALTINSNNPIFQLRNNNVDKGFVQLVDDDIKIGTNISNTAGKFIIRTKGVDRLTIDENGNGTFGNSTSGGSMIINGPSFAGFVLQANNLTQGVIQATNQEFDIFRSNPGALRIRANGDGMWFWSNGQVSLGGGGQTATGYTLNIEGKAIATEFRVLAVGSWPDYVFAKDYKLKPLAEVRKFINENNHLPNIPPAAEIEKKGVELGDMSKRLIEKVEELTLYVLQLQEQIDDLKKQIPVKKEN